MDKCSTDAEFDSYWDYEAKNKERNRIRVGRQYQATIPPRLRPGENDGRKCEDLETLKWKPGQISDQEVEQYLSMAKGISLFARAVDPSKTNVEKSDNSLQSAIKGLSEFVASHHPSNHDDGCTVPSSSGESSSKINATNDWSPSEAQLFAQALEACGKNFCAIKKEFLPWKPVRSIIEYYYQGKADKSPSHDLEENIKVKKEETEEQKAVGLSHIKKDVEPVPGCSYEEKPPPTKQEMPPENPSPQNLDSNSKADAVNFLEVSRATDACPDGTDVKPTSVQNEDTKCASSTVGSLKFFLGGRLVLKLNARQDSGSGAKCQWVQSNDVPRHSNHAKKVKHKKKSIQDFISSPETPQKKKKTAEAVTTPKTPDHSLSASKKPQVKSEYEFSEGDKQGMLLCSSYWTPPVADGQEPVDADDASSKTSEGYVSPVLSNSRPVKVEVRGEVSGSLNSVQDNCEKSELDQSSAKYNNAQSELYSDDSASKNLSFAGGKNSPCQLGEDAFLKQELLNQKSALSHSKFQVKSSSYPPRSCHSNSGQLLKQWSKWSSVSYPMRTCSVSPVSVMDAKSPLKETPLDLSSKPENDAANPLEKNGTNADCLEKSFPPEAESRPASNEFSPQSSSLGSHQQIAESPKGDAASISKRDTSCCSVKSSGESNQISYTCCNLPNCSSPKCTKDYCTDDHPCNKGNPDLGQESCSGYSIQEMDESMCKKNHGWCKGSYVQFYPQCYPYYLTYSISPSPGSDSSGAEVPLDLSAASDSLKEKVSDKISDEVNDLSHSNSAEAVERGMLYQLLKNKTSK